MGRVTDQQSSIHACNRYTKGRKGGELARLQILLKSRTPLPTKGNSKRTMSEKRKNGRVFMAVAKGVCVCVQLEASHRGEKRLEGERASDFRASEGPFTWPCRSDARQRRSSR